jgi:hypothetical protein
MAQISKVNRLSADGATVEIVFKKTGELPGGGQP